MAKEVSIILVMNNAYFEKLGQYKPNSASASQTRPISMVSNSGNISGFNKIVIY